MPMQLHIQTEDESRHGRTLSSNLPTYRKVSSIHCGNPRLEVKIRLSNLEQTLEHEAPQDLALTDKIRSRMFETGEINFGQASMLPELHRRTPTADQWTLDQIGLLLNAGGYAVSDGDLCELDHAMLWPEA